MENHGDGKLKKPKRYNLNRGYQKLRVWQDAILLYTMILKEFKGLPFEFKKIAGQEMAAADSIHRNIAEGYCRRSIREYIQFLYVALASLGETVSGLFASKAANVISEEQFEKLDSFCYKVENELISLIRSLENKRDKGDWIDHMVRENGRDMEGRSSEGMQ
ncbi:MAG: four helix bundle protein [Desulfatiglandales bacterium]